ncbi:hypothetical protein GCM10007423_27010 [Dyadobacter endophyticus]|uniref:Copper amine oxidase-like N-terminal domain-containing protein n=1 Tax=Dyadobacter endophyticus TaxID=1749036 RepID=A0ABQ1YTA5_9BACT|nr:hypothetical protein [Dyadobacter endophyticus]GGH35404.1 hypothetical protein GCM10007423_27010 [Dyadobacter endophyticus]
MKLKAIKFFSPEENLPKTQQAKAAPLPAGYISNSGKLVFPAVALRDLGIDPESTNFKIGTQDGKRKIKSLYLVPAASSDQTFSFEKSGRGHVIPLAVILKRGGLNFEGEKLIFKISTFDFDKATKGYELTIESETPKPEYTGKPRGRKPKAAVDGE